MSEFKEFKEKLKRLRRIIRITVVGDGAVGKTTLIKAMLNLLEKNESYEYNYEEVKRTPFMSIERWKLNNLSIQCYDLAGQRRPGAHPIDVLSDQVLREIDVIIFVFALNRFESFENLNEWKEIIEKSLENNSPYYLLVGNKADLGKEVPQEMIDNIVGDDKPFKRYVETVAIKNQGITDLVDALVSVLELRLTAVVSKESSKKVK